MQTKNPVTSTSAGDINNHLLLHLAKRLQVAHLNGIIFSEIRFWFMKSAGTKSKGLWNAKCLCIQDLSINKINTCISRFVWALIIASTFECLLTHDKLSFAFSVCPTEITKSWGEFSTSVKYSYPKMASGPKQSFINVKMQFMACEMHLSITEIWNEKWEPSF